MTVRDLGRVKCGIVTFSVDGTPAETVAARLSESRVNVSVSSASYSRLDLGGRGLDALVRASVHYYNTADELERLLGVVRAIR